MFFLQIFNPVANVGAFFGMAKLSIRHRGLVSAMTSRELTDRYAGQFLGSAWAIISPLLAMLIYVLVFTFIFKGRLGQMEDTTAFTAYALSGLAAWIAFGEGVSRSIGAITNNSNLVKQIVFPVEVLPLKIVLATFPTLAIGVSLAIAASSMAGLLDVSRLLVWLPACVVGYFFFVAGLAYFLASLGVFFRDLKDIVAFLLGIGLFFNPIIYPPDGAPPWIRDSFPFNPVSNMIYCFHYAIVGPVENYHQAWIAFPVFSVVTFALGWRTFRTLKPTFGNAL